MFIAGALPIDTLPLAIIADILHFVRKAVPPGVGTTPHCRPTRVHGEPHTLVTTMVLASDLPHFMQVWHL